MPGTPGEWGCIQLPLGPPCSRSTKQVWGGPACPCGLSSLIRHLVAASGHSAPCRGCHGAAQALGHLSRQDQPEGSAGSPRGGLGPCQGLKCNNAPAPGTFQHCPGQQGWSPMGLLGFKPWMWDPPSPRAHPSLGSHRGVCNEPTLPGELGAPHSPPGQGGSGAGLRAEGSVCVCVFWGMLWGWWVSPSFPISVGSCGAGGCPCASPQAWGAQPVPDTGRGVQGAGRGAVPMGQCSGRIASTGVAPAHPTLRTGC